MNSITSYRLAVLYLVIGAAIFSLSSIFKSELSDFAFGVCVGVSGALLVRSGIYLIRYFFMKKKS